MYKYLLLTLLTFKLFAGSPISYYERIIDTDKRLKYTQVDGNFSFKVQKIINMDNMYYQGDIDNFDDGYIQAILASQTPFKTIHYRDYNRTIHIVFDTKINDADFIKNFDTKNFEDEKLNVKLYIFDKSKIRLPVNLSVYPFYVIDDRFIQGGSITKEKLKMFFEVSAYSNKPTITLKKLKVKIAKKFKLTDEKVDVKYNKTIKLFEVRLKNQKRVHSLISCDGRYIIAL